MFVAQKMLPTPREMLPGTSMLMVCAECGWKCAGLTGLVLSICLPTDARGNHQELWKVTKESWFVSVSMNCKYVEKSAHAL